MENIIFDKTLLLMAKSIRITILYVKEIITLISGCGADDQETMENGKGNSTFMAKVDYDAENGPIYVAMGDLDDDGTLDLAAG